MKLYLALGLAGAAGASSRYLLGLLAATAAPGPFPLGTLLINLSGSLVLGLLVGHDGLPERWRIPVATGFLGAYTTFSTWTVDTIRLYEEGHVGLAGANVAVSLLLGLPLVWIGLRIGARLKRSGRTP